MPDQSSDPAIKLHLSRQQSSAMTQLIVSRLKQLRQRIETESTDHDSDEYRDRIRVLGEFMNAINGATITDPESGLKYHTYDPGMADEHRLQAELAGLYSICRPKDAHTGITADVEEVAHDLAGWAHRADEDPIDPDIFFSDPTGY